MSEIEMNQEQIENKVQRRTGKRGRSKSSLDRTIEESEAITKSLGPEPEIAEGRRRTRSSMKSVIIEKTIESSPPPAKKEKKSTPKTNRGRGRKPLKKGEINEIEEEVAAIENNVSDAAVVNNNESIAEEPEKMSKIEETEKVDKTDVTSAAETTETAAVSAEAIVDETDEKINGEASKVSISENGNNLIEAKKAVDDKSEQMEVVSDSVHEEKKDGEPEDKKESQMVVDKNGSVDATDEKVATQEESVSITEVTDSKIESENTKTD